jgi:DNA-binding phage protein
MSNNTLARLSVEVAANTASLETDMGKAARIAETEMQKMERSAVRMAATLSATLVAAGGALAVLAKQSIDAADEMGELAEKVGMSTERLSAYNYIAKMSGADTELMSSSIKKLNVNMVEAANGQGAAKKAFEELGIELRDANGNLKDNDTILVQVAERMSKMEDGAAKTALAVAIFGKAGADLIPMLNQGARGFADLTEEAKRMGLIISTDAAKAAGELNDSIDRLTLATRGLGNAVMQSTLPALNAIAKSLVEENSLLRDSIRMVGAAGAAYVAATLAMNAKVIALKAATVAQLAFNNAAKANPYALAAAGLGLLVAAIYNYNKAVPEAVKRTEEASTAMSRFDAIARRAKEAIDSQNRAAAGMNLPQVKDKIASVSNEIKRLEMLHKRASADFARGAVSAGLVGSYDAQLKQKKQQLEYLNTLVGEKIKDSPVQKAVAATTKSAGTSKASGGTDNFDYSKSANLFKNMDDTADGEAASAAAYIERDKDRVKAALESIQQGLMSRRQLEMQDFEQKRITVEQSTQYLLMSEQQKLATMEALERDHKAKLKALDDEELRQKNEQRQKMVGLVNNGLSTIASSQSKYAKVAQMAQKAQALWQVGIDTRAMMVGAYKAMVGIPVVGPALAVAASSCCLRLWCGSSRRHRRQYRRLRLNRLRFLCRLRRLRWLHGLHRNEILCRQRQHDHRDHHRADPGERHHDRPPDRGHAG